MRSSSSGRGDAPLDSKRVLRGLRAYTYRYKKGAARLLGEDTKRRVGVMAQDMERSSPETRSAVIPAKEGLMLHGERSLGVALGTLPDLARRLSALEDGPRRGGNKTRKRS